MMAMAAGTAESFKLPAGKPRLSHIHLHLLFLKHASRFRQWAVIAKWLPRQIKNLFLFESVGAAAVISEKLHGHPRTRTSLTGQGRQVQIGVLLTS